MIPKSLYSRFFAAHRRACDALGFRTPEECENFYRQVCLEEAHTASVKTIATLSDFDRCVARFEAVGGDYQSALQAEIENQKRRAYVVKVLVCQILQLNGVGYGNAREYLEGVFERSKIGAGFRASNASWFMDVPALNLHKVLQMLDTHLRRLKKRLDPVYPKGCKTGFNDRIRFWNDAGKWTAEAVEKYYYSSRPFYVVPK